MDGDGGREIVETTDRRRAVNGLALGQRARGLHPGRRDWMPDAAGCSSRRGAARSQAPALEPSHHWPHGVPTGWWTRHAMGLGAKSSSSPYCLRDNPRATVARENPNNPSRRRRPINPAASRSAPRCENITVSAPGAHEVTDNGMFLARVVRGPRWRYLGAAAARALALAHLSNGMRSVRHHGRMAEW